MGPVEAIRSGFEKFVTWEGRASRSEYWFFYLVVIIPLLVLLAIMDSENGKLVAIGYALLTILPFISLTVRRLHDTNHSGWWYWIVIVPCIGPIILLAYMCWPSDSGTNDYGQNPFQNGW